MTGQTLPVRMIGSLAVVTLPDEIDLLNVTHLHDGLEEMLGKAPGTLVVDMTRTRYCDSAGIAVLVRVAEAARARQVPLRVAVSDPVSRIMRLLGAERVIDVYPSLAAALGGEAQPAARDGQPPGPAQPPAAGGPAPRDEEA
jgi:anti-sigma B factor antagonist